METIPRRVRETAKTDQLMPVRGQGIRLGFLTLAGLFFLVGVFFIYMAMLSKAEYAEAQYIAPHANWGSMFDTCMAGGFFVASLISVAIGNTVHNVAVIAEQLHSR